VSFFREIKKHLVRSADQFDETDLRWSYIIIAILFVVCILINWLFASQHGWTVWPFAAGISVMVLINEAADRSGQGVPPLQVYALFGGSLLAFLVVTLVLSATNIFIILFGFMGLLYYCGRGYLEGKRREQLIAARVSEGLCVHCGEPADYSMGYCEACGNDPNPSVTQLKRVQAVSRKNVDSARIRSVLKQDSLGASARRKEQALIARRRTPRGR
jgi:hypothetical protein